jgi:hypothetical protein
MEEAAAPGNRPACGRMPDNSISDDNAAPWMRQRLPGRAHAPAASRASLPGEELHLIFEAAAKGQGGGRVLSLEGRCKAEVRRQLAVQPSLC